MPRRHDPGRRERIAEAAVRVISAGGIAALSHRAVAAEADVPLGSTTYHYASLDELLLAALRRVNDAWLDRFTAWARAVDPAAPLAGELADFIADSLTRHRAQAELEYEFYVAGLRHPAVRPLAAECLEAMVAVVRPLLPDADRARAVVGLLDGVTLQLVLTGREPDRAELRALLEPLVPPPGTGWPAAPAAG